MVFYNRPAAPVIPRADQEWLTKVGQDPEFQRLYKNMQEGVIEGGVAPSYAFNQYINKIGMPPGRALDMSGGQLALKDRTSGWTIPLAAVAAAATLGVAAFAPAVLGMGGVGGGGAAGAGGSAGGAAAAGGAGTAASTAGGAGGFALSGLPASTINTAAVSGVFGATGTGATAGTAGTVGMWSKVAKYGKKAFDAYQKYGEIADGVSDSLGAMADTSAQNRGEKAMYALHARRDAREHEADAYGKAMRGAYGMNVQDVTFDTSKFHGKVPDVSFSGGSRPSAFGPEGRAAASTLYQNASERLKTAGQPLEIPEGSFWEKLAGPAGMFMKVAGKWPRKTKAPGYNPSEEGTT